MQVQISQLSFFAEHYVSPEIALYDTKHSDKLAQMNLKYNLRSIFLADIVNAKQDTHILLETKTQIYPGDRQKTTPYIYADGS